MTMDEKKTNSGMSERKTILIRQLLKQCVHEYIVVDGLCELIIDYVPHSTIRACSLLHDPFKVIDTMMIPYEDCILYGTSFNTCSFGVGRDQVQIGGFLENCGPPIHPSECWTIDNKLARETKNNITMETFTITHTQKDKKHTVMMRCLHPTTACCGTIPSISVSPDKKTMLYRATSREPIDGQIQYKTKFVFESHPVKNNKNVTISIEDTDNRYSYYSNVEWLNGNRHIAFANPEDSLLVLQIPDTQVEKKEDTYVVVHKKGQIPSMTSQKMEQAWSNKEVHTFPVLFLGEFRVCDVNLCQNFFLVKMSGHAWIIGYRDRTWWIERKIADTEDLYLQWSLSGAHLIVKNELLDSIYSISVDTEKKRILYEPEVTSKHAIPDIVESDPSNEYDICNRIFSYFHAQPRLGIRVRKNGPFFVAHTANWISLFCRETGEQLQLMRFDESKEICFDCIWNSSSTRLFVVLVRGKKRRTFHLLTLCNTDFETHLQTTYASYPRSKTPFFELFPKHNTKLFKYMGFFL